MTTTQARGEDRFGGAPSPAAAPLAEVLLSAERSRTTTRRVSLERVRLTRRFGTESVDVRLKVRREELVVTGEPVPAGLPATEGPHWTQPDDGSGGPRPAPSIPGKDGE